jgi:hypothetical protein
MKGMQTIFENEEATRLLNYFIAYKEIVTKTENKIDSSIATDIPLSVEHGS